MKNNYNLDEVLKILALALDNNTPKHRIVYLLEKLNSKFYGLDVRNEIFLDEIKKISEEIK